VINPADRRYSNVIDEIEFYIDKFETDIVLVDPFKSIINDIGMGDSRDLALNELFINTKMLTQRKNINFNWIAHPKSFSDVKEKDGRFKVVTQFLVSGGAAWDNNMDGQYSVYRPQRHVSPSDPNVHFWNLKQRQSELVGVSRGVYESIIFDVRQKRYFFNGVCPIDGSTRGDIFAKRLEEKVARETNKSELGILFNDDKDKVPF
jgi:hypothetical protein